MHLQRCCSPSVKCCCVHFRSMWKRYWQYCD